MRADVVPVAADVSGLVTAVKVADNQKVRKGDVLFIIDRPRYRLALEQAEANVTSQRTALAQAVREDRRNRAMPEVIAAEVIERGSARVEGLRATIGQAVAARDLARFQADTTAQFLDEQAALLRERSSNQWITTNYTNVTTGTDPRRAKALDFATFTLYPVAGANVLGGDSYKIGNPARLMEAIAYRRLDRAKD